MLAMGASMSGLQLFRYSKILTPGRVQMSYILKENERRVVIA